MKNNSKNNADLKTEKNNTLSPSSSLDPQAQTPTEIEYESLTQMPHIDTKSKVKNDGEPRLPHERDESPDAQTIEPRPVIKQAYNDLKNGLVDTDLRGKPGLKITKP